MNGESKYSKLFGHIPVIGMIHLAGDSSREKVSRALEEITIYENEGVTGVIVENYHGDLSDVVSALREIYKSRPHVCVGVNILNHPFRNSFTLAHDFGFDFVQMDHVAGRYEEDAIEFVDYAPVRTAHPDILVLGGVWPKYYHPVEGSNLESDIRAGKLRADAIVVTGDGTGVETPFDKIEKFRLCLGDYPLVVGAGLTPENAYEQLIVADGCIVGSCFKIGNDTRNKVDKHKVKAFMDSVKKARAYRVGMNHSQGPV